MDERLFFPATSRNRDCIAEALSKFLPDKGSVLEIASGSGEHGVAFQKLFPFIKWQTSDPNHSYRKSIRAWIIHQGLEAKMPQPIDLDVESKPWPLAQEFRRTLKTIVCINMLHISSWGCTQSLFEESANHLKKNNLLILYGPFQIDGKHTSKSNELFDHSLKTQNPNWGVRDLAEVNAVATSNGLKNHAVIEMQAHNLLVAFKKS
ncbi:MULTISPECIES: DUF938 domain-containing protein [Prochlorococcus]|uniref:SAM-dependent methyltransferase n=1 Tax=Prochlorococcus marinus (strain SARG / CCMP1375 / SS120) TaxID=167539 RepID=Q7VAJ9_PROMA|nr:MULTISPECIES: DUF938 domain-containing protein [Prochlorococcus]AAQ00507.1 SAM-dependent methyltransferase [Prochlorococcus marinus subsp. marinus str. CCMP1375]KGG10323.1 hypothetical protein EV04_1989 [Prochlorococcus marinus str. LG]KGG22590.1 hypothetical protein EV08_0005 [Prochlorococcus marinus str. SS2]KGG24257.1 hypothetical protein EV09_0864 [Prochlorococcus marinus str. SS35]KGG33130.1 hypothetical protein EV10_0763 [Prochlorococcus marinus str. SS51]